MALENNPDIDRRALRQLMIQQYLLHEIEHHDLQAAGTSADVAILPKAHNLTDVYKCLHQGEFGVGHSIDNPIRFRQHLEHEWRSCLDFVRPGDREPTLETVSSDGGVLRVNLRPLGPRFAQRLGEASELLTQVCLQSAQGHQGSAERFLDTLVLFKAINQAGEIRLAGRAFVFPAELAARFLTEVRRFSQHTGQVPVLGHSEAYRRLNRPAYRVVDRAALADSALGFLLAENEKETP